MMNRDKFNSVDGSKNKIKRPAPFIAQDAKEFATKEEIQKRLIRIERAKSVGQDITRVDSDDCEIENPYRVKALLYIIKDMEVPRELVDKIKEFDKENGIVVNYE